MVTFGYPFRSFQQGAKEFLAEFLGTFLLVFIGNCTAAQTILTNGEGGNVVTIYFGSGFGIFLGVLVSARTSGGHLNPAVSVAGAVMKKFKWRKVPHYLVAQYLGAFVGACGTYAVYLDSFNEYHGLHGINKTTASIFATYPKENLSVTGSLVDQVFGTFLLLVGIYATTDPFNKVPPSLVPYNISLTLISVACSLGINQGYAVNPARDLGPRFFTYISKWGRSVFEYESHWYAAIIGPHLGAIIGAFVYVYLVEKPRIQRNASSRSGVVTNSDMTSTKGDSNKEDDNFCRL